MINVVPLLRIVLMPPGSQTRNVTKYHYQVYPIVFHPIGNRGHPTSRPVMQLSVLQTWICFPPPRDLSTFGVGAGRKATTVLYPEKGPRRHRINCWTFLSNPFYITFDQCTIFNLFNWPHKPYVYNPQLPLLQLWIPKRWNQFCFDVKWT